MPLETKHWKAKPILCVPIKKRAEGARAKRHVSDPAAHPAHSRAARPRPVGSRARNHAEPHPDTRPHADVPPGCADPARARHQFPAPALALGRAARRCQPRVGPHEHQGRARGLEICAHAARRRVALPRPRLVQHRAHRARHVSTRDARCRHPCALPRHRR